MRPVLLLLFLTTVGTVRGFAFLAPVRSATRNVASAPLHAAATLEEVDTRVLTGNKILWQPSQDDVEPTAMYKFQQDVMRNHTIGGGYEDLWKWSVENGDDFWEALLGFVGVEYTGSTEPVREGDHMPDVTYFPNVRLNFAENLLRHGRTDSPLRDAEAVVSISEARPDKRWTFSELRHDAACVAAALARSGVTQEDAVGAYLPNVGEAIVAMLGATSVGAIWSSCSDDFGAQAVADRFGQIRPKVLFTCKAVVSKSKRSSMVGKVEALAETLPSLERIVVIDMLEDDDDTTDEWQDEKVREMVMSWDDFLSEGSNEDGSAPESSFTPVSFSHPQFVLYSSGTTGPPKSITHGAGNVLLQHAKELMLHSDLRLGDRMLYFTTTGWMMWNWMTSSLFAGATVVCFDGFAAYPRLDSPWDVVARERITHLGTTPRYLQACRKRVRPGRDFDLSALRVVLSTGSPLAPEDFDYVYDKVKRNILLASISGGTDICSCFALGSPLLPVREGELQAAGLGMDVCAYDDEKQEAAPASVKGELVCRSPFVAAPVSFYGDDERKTKYRNAYFRNEVGIWYHGDLVEVTGSAGDAGGFVIHGRSDTTLNPGGIRIGTAEVYRFAEEADSVEDSLVIGERMIGGKRAGDVRIVLFVQLKNGMELTPDIEGEIRATIRSGASDAHVPAIIRQVRKIPYTKSGKKVEIAVRDLFAGIEPKNVGALRDPSAFDEYRRMAEEGL